MAITLITAPTEIKSTSSPIIFRVTSTSTDITTEIKGEVWYRRNQEDFYTLAGTQLQKKSVGYAYYEYNIASVVDKLLTSDYQTGSTGVYTNIDNSAIEIVLRFTEYYPSSAFVAVASTTTGSYYVCNTKLYHTETQSLAAGGNDWYMNGTNANKFLTDAPLITYIRASERVQLGFLTSFTDPCIVLRETKNNLSTASVEYALPDATFTRYLWNWAVDEDEVVTMVQDLPFTGTAFINAISAAPSGYIYKADSDNKMWGAIKLLTSGHQVDIDLPNLTASTADINFRVNSVSGTVNYTVWYEIASVWTVSVLGAQSCNTTHSTYTETIPANATAVRVVCAGGMYIYWGTVVYVDDNVQNKRCQFTIDTSHIDSDTKQLEVWALQSTGSNIISEVRTFLVDTEQYYEDTTRFAVKNKRGDYDHFTYTQMHSEILTAEKTRSRRELPNTFTTKDRGLTVDKVVSEKIFTCYSRYIEEAELQWWATIIESDEVYVIVNDVQYAVDIVTDSVVTYTHTDLVQLKIDWTYAVTR